MNVTFGAQHSNLRKRFDEQMAGKSPYAGAEWGGLVSQLQNQAAGKGPSMAQDAYRGAQMDTTAALGSMSRGGSSPAAARQAMMQRAGVGQGMAQGLASARTQEMIAGQQALGQALSQRDQLNQNAYQNLSGQRMTMEELELRRMQGNQQYKLGMQNAPSDFQKNAGVVSGFASALAPW